MGEVGAHAPGEGLWLCRILESLAPLTPALSKWERGLHRGYGGIAGFHNDVQYGFASYVPIHEEELVGSPLPLGEVGADAPGERADFAVSLRDRIPSPQPSPHGRGGYTVGMVGSRASTMMCCTALLHTFPSTKKSPWDHLSH